MVCPKSLARRRLRLSQAKVRSTTPPPRVDDEAGLVGDFAHDLDVDGGRHGDARAGICPARAVGFHMMPSRSGLATARNHIETRSYTVTSAF